MTDQEKNWRKGFELVGPDTLRLQLATVLSGQSTQFKRCAEAWILEKDAEKAAIESRRFRKVLGWTIVGTVAAIIAAVAATISVVR